MLFQNILTLYYLAFARCASLFAMAGDRGPVPAIVASDLLEYLRCFVEYFTGLTNDELSILRSHFRLRKMLMNDVVMRSGARASFWGIVCTGAISVMRPGAQVLRSEILKLAICCTSVVAFNVRMLRLEFDNRMHMAPRPSGKGHAPWHVLQWLERLRCGEGPGVIGSSRFFISGSPPIRNRLVLLHNNLAC